MQFNSEEENSYFYLNQIFNLTAFKTISPNEKFRLGLLILLQTKTFSSSEETEKQPCRDRRRKAILRPQ